MENITLEESIVSAMEGNNTKLFKYLPYIFQDFWELGSSPDEIINVIKKYKQDYSSLNVLDLGSGKGAVSIKIASELKCNCFGIDAIEEFVIFSNNKSKELSVSNFCTFEANDARKRIKSLGKYDIIILGAIGPVFGNYYNTLLELAPHLNDDGIIIIGDAYVEDNCTTDYPNVLQKTDILKQVSNAEMKIVEIITTNEIIPKLAEEYEIEIKDMVNRCNELIEKHPEDKNVFLDYLETQKKLSWKLLNEVTQAILVIK